MAACESELLIESLKAIVGLAGYREGADIESKNYQGAMGARSIPPVLLLRPDSTEQVSEILKACHGAGQGQGDFSGPKYTWRIGPAKPGRARSCYGWRRNRSEGGG